LCWTDGVILFRQVAVSHGVLKASSVPLFGKSST